MYQSVVTAQSIAVSYYYKPQILGGGNWSFENVTHNDIGLDPVSPDGIFRFEIIERQRESFKISVSSNLEPEVLVATITLNNLEWSTFNPDD